MTKVPGYWTHKRISIVKSVVRLAGCLAGIVDFRLLCLGLALAEGLGVWEEMGGRG